MESPGTARMLEELIQANRRGYPPRTGFIKLNVGGKMFATTVETLTRISDTFFSGFFKGDFVCSIDEFGCYFIDRDGELFRYVLNYLRTGALHASQQDLLLQVRDEALFFQIVPLIHLVEENLEEIRMKKEAKAQQRVCSSMASREIATLGSKIEVISRYIEDTAKKPLDDGSPKKSAIQGSESPALKPVELQIERKFELDEEF
eukprot:TRINITY_DN11242_c0_g1_i1.p1 TRINITY_DN11242_c0_g1~~TRINITY_DN11242_c0_g1_i1.p1  ORF type:complete len:204 (+),score=56.11 TRINITY_DN11242_c0_g1_i1:50-661(+)